MIEPEIVTPTGQVIAPEGNRFTLEEHRTYRVRVPGPPADRVCLGALDLPYGPEGYALAIDASVGEQTLRIERGGIAYTWPVQLAPRAEKLTEESFVSLVTELEAWLPGVLVGDDQALLGSVGFVGAALPLLAQALAPLLPPLERALAALAARPRTVVRAPLEEVALHQVRRADRETLAWLARHPEIAQHLGPNPRPAVRPPPPGVPIRVPADRRDHPANRYVAWLVRQALRVVDRTARELRERAASLEAPLGDWARARAERLASGGARLQRVFRTSFLHALSPRPPSEAALQVVLDDPAYARVHRLARPFLAPGFRLDAETHAPTAAPVRPSFTLYELWCFLAVQRQLARALPGTSWTHTRLAQLLHPRRTPAGAVVRGQTPCGERITLRFNPTFSSFLTPRPQHGRWSISRERRPDLTVDLKRPDGTGAWLCLDAKYIVRRESLAEAFASAHVYRDALRWPRRGGRCRSALLLAPNRAHDEPGWFEAAFRDEEGCGAWVLRPGAPEASDLGAWIVGTLSSPSSPHASRSDR